MKKQRSLTSNSAKKRKILLGTLIPVGCIVATTVIVVPIVLTQCKSIDNLKLEGESTFTVQQIKDGVTLHIKNMKSSWSLIAANDFLTETTIKGITKDGFEASDSQRIIALRYLRGSGDPVLMASSSKWDAVVPGEKILYGKALTPGEFQDMTNSSGTAAVTGENLKLVFNVV